jgi:hypothetical protein
MLDNVLQDSIPYFSNSESVGKEAKIVHGKPWYQNVTFMIDI